MPEEHKTLEKNLDKLQRIFSFMDEDILSKKDFTDAFERVIKLVIKIQEQQGEAISRLEETYNNLISRIRGEHSESLTSLKKEINELFVGDKLKEMGGEMKISFAKLQDKIDEKIKKAEVITEALRNESSRAVFSAKSAESSSASVSARIAEATNSVRNVQEVRKIIINELKKVQDELEIIRKTPRGRLGMRKVPIIRAIDLSADE